MPFTLLADTLNIPPIVGQNSGLVLSVTPAAANVVFDGMGNFYPPDPSAVFAPGIACSLIPLFENPPSSVFPGIFQPNPPLGISLTLQAVFPDPAAFYGITRTHARWPFDL